MDIQTIGNADLLKRPLLALFCSVQCPGKLILETYDLAKRLREEGVPVISPFHSPMEQECLRILLRGPTPAVWCLARGMYKTIPVKPIDCRSAVEDGRLMVVSSFSDKERRITTEAAIKRNRLVADLASAVFVAHAAPGSKMEALCLDILAVGKPLYTFNHPSNSFIIQAGAKDGTTVDFGLFTSYSAAEAPVSPFGVFS